ncbi:hypothetical protein HW555_013347 [Spodoptera exigua]|uniref:Uncharacterized protein n=1 Tax=Spodoptera exigua TaxID=7107 RepID=A0A835G5U2_SPOEX|nr:hypothetical protein HW555_013347 [Spodoptera exigua]
MGNISFLASSLYAYLCLEKSVPPMGTRSMLYSIPFSLKIVLLSHILWQSEIFKGAKHFGNKYWNWKDETRILHIISIKRPTAESQHLTRELVYTIYSSSSGVVREMVSQ